MCWVSGHRAREHWKYVEILLYPLPRSAGKTVDHPGSPEPSPQVSCGECRNPPKFRCRWVLPLDAENGEGQSNTYPPKETWGELYDHLCFDCLSENVGWLQLEIWKRKCRL